MIGIPDLYIQSGRNLILGLIPGKHGLFLRDDNLLLCLQIVEGINEAPVEVSFTGQRMIVDISVLFILLLTLQPAGEHTSENNSLLHVTKLVFV